MTMPPTDYQSQRESLQNFILDRDFERLEDELAEFNLFDVLGVEHKELQHSALLAWLLNPRGSHGTEGLLSQEVPVGCGSGSHAARHYEHYSNSRRPLEAR